MSSVQNVRRFVLAVACTSAAVLLLAAPATARADDTYAAIAFSPSTGNYGFGNDGTREKAETKAVANCKGDDAQVAVWVKNGFCYLAVGANNKYGIGFDKDGPTALKTAIAECRKVTTYTKEAGGFTQGERTSGCCQAMTCAGHNC